MYFRQKTKSTVAWLIVAAMLLPILFAVSGIFGFFGLGDGNIFKTESVGAETGLHEDVDYLAAGFDDLDHNDHVFDVVTYDRLCTILCSDGTSLIVLASTRNETSAAAMGAINEAAKAFGVEKIYYFDVHTSAEYGSDFTNGNDMTDVPAGYQVSAASAMDYGIWWDYLKNHLAAKTRNGINDGGSAGLSQLPADYNSDDTLLFAFNRRGTGGLAGPILKGQTRTYTVTTDTWTLNEPADANAGQVMLSQISLKEADLATFNETTFKANITTMLGTAFPGFTPGAGKNPGETKLGQYDYFSTWAASGNAGLSISPARKDNFRVHIVTFYEFMYLLDLPGERILTINGSW